MMNRKLTIVSNCDDWEGFYVNNKLKLEGHSLRLDQVLEVLGFTVEYIECDNQWLYEYGGTLPTNLEDVE
jgi:hypothetical protein